MGVNIKIEGIPSATSFLHNKSSAIYRAAEAAIIKAGFFIEGEVKNSIAGQRAEPKSVDTGRFLNSVFTEIKGLTAKIESPVEYAKYLEYGTSRIYPRHHFTNTSNRNKAKVQGFVDEEIKKAAD